MEGTNRRSDMFYCQRLSSRLHGREKQFLAVDEDV